MDVALETPGFHSGKRKKLPDFQSSFRMHMGMDFGGTYIKFKLMNSFIQISILKLNLIK